MQNADWVHIFRQIPADRHPHVVLVLNNRMEISVETFLRIEPAYLLVRGRMGGTTDGGLPYVVPFAQLSAFYLFREIKEDELETVFGSASAGKTLTRSAQAVSERPPVPAAGPAPAAAPAFGPPPQGTSVARNNLLERLRAARQAATPPPNGK